jgi:hypothetical protein
VIDVTPQHTSTERPQLTDQADQFGYRGPGMPGDPFAY